MTEPVTVGVVGCGTISDAYLENLVAYDHLRVVACADLDRARAAATAERFGVARACAVDELIADHEIELVVNLTSPAAHAEVGLAAVRAGKAVYNEKPFAHTREAGRELLREAADRGVRVGGAPDTILGPTVQSARLAIDGGQLGEPVAATSIMYQRGHEGWHPNPAFLYKPGGGPLLDGGPYRLAALVTLLGPVARVTGLVRATYPERLIRSEPHAGERVPVEVPTHVAALLEFENGVIATTAYSWDLWAAEAESVLEVQCSRGTVAFPVQDGNPLRIRMGGEGPPAWSEERPPWTERPLEDGPREPTFGIGIAEMADALRAGRPHRASGELAFHVLDISLAIYEASDQGRCVTVESTCERPQPIGADWLSRAPA
jgi:predicted dehydrogenase